MKITSFDRNQSVMIRRLAADETKGLETRIKAKGSINQELDKFSNTLPMRFTNLLQNNDPKDVNSKPFKRIKDSQNLIEELSAKFKDRLRPEIKTREQLRIIGDTKIIAESHRLREIDPKSIIQIKMKLSEEGMEWIKIDKEDGTHDFQLMPE